MTTPIALGNARPSPRPGVALTVLLFALLGGRAEARQVTAPYQPELVVALGYSELMKEDGASFGLHGGAFPTRVLYLGGHLDLVTVRDARAAVLGAELGARYAKGRSPRFTGFLTAGMLADGAEARGLLGLGLRIDFLVADGFLLGVEGRWSTLGLVGGDDYQSLGILMTARAQLGFVF